MLSIIRLRLLRLRDEYPAFVLLTAMALGLTFIFGMSMDGYKPTVLIVDEDQSRYSERFIREMDSYGGFRFRESDYEDGVKAVEEGDVVVAVVINKGFGLQIEGGKEAAIGLMKVKDSMDSATLQKLISAAAVKMMGSVRISSIAADFISSHKDGTDYEKVSEQAFNKVMEYWSYRKPVSVSGVAVDVEGDSKSNNMKHSMIGFSVFFSMYTMVFGIGTILYDKQHKTWQRMLVSPVSHSAILGGSMFAAYIMGAVQMGVLIAGGKYLLKMDWGDSTAGILLVAGAFVFAATSLGLMLSGMVKSHSQLSAVSPVVLTSTAMLGGCMWPLEMVNSKVLLFLSNFTPQKWAVQGMERIASYGQGFEAAVVPTLILLLMGAVFFAAGVRLVRFE